MLRTVLFGSLDLLTDITSVEAQAFDRAFDDLGHSKPWSPDAYLAMMTTHGRFGGPRRLLEDASIDRDILFERVQRELRDLIDSREFVLRPWTEARLKKARRRGLRIGLVSGAERQTTLRLLAALFGSRASVVFDVVTCSDLGDAPKPAPDLYLRALAATSTSPDRALAYEPRRDGRGDQVPGAARDDAIAGGSLGCRRPSRSRPPKRYNRHLPTMVVKGTRDTSRRKARHAAPRVCIRPRLTSTDSRAVSGRGGLRSSGRPGRPFRLPSIQPLLRPVVYRHR